jgi:hypothetical protein
VPLPANLLVPLRKLYPYIAALLVYAFTPGLCEFAEVAIHFVDTGDFHASDEERHAEHGESQSEDGECHSCICHAHTAFVAPPLPMLSSVETSVEFSVFFSENALSGSASGELFRPPIA